MYVWANTEIKYSYVQLETLHICSSKIVVLFVVVIHASTTWVCHPINHKPITPVGFIFLLKGETEGDNPGFLSDCSHGSCLNSHGMIRYNATNMFECNYSLALKENQQWWMACMHGTHPSSEGGGGTLLTSSIPTPHLRAAANICQTHRWWP